MTLSQPGSRYDEDFALWLKQTIELLQIGQFAELDIDALIEELDSMGKRDRRELLSRLKVLLMHLLKWQYQPSHRGASWEITIRNHREEIQQILADSPSLRPYLESVLNQVYSSARQNASAETGLALSRFPKICAYTIAQVLAADFWPEVTPEL